MLEPHRYKSEKAQDVRSHQSRDWQGRSLSESLERFGGRAAPSISGFWPPQL